MKNMYAYLVGSLMVGFLWMETAMAGFHPAMVGVVATFTVLFITIWHEIDKEEKKEDKQND